MSDESAWEEVAALRRSLRVANAAKVEAHRLLAQWQIAYSLSDEGLAKLRAATDVALGRPIVTDDTTEDVTPTK